jgi:hypothetical protein
MRKLQASILTNCFTVGRQTHIGIPQSGVVGSGHLTFLGQSILDFPPETSRDTAIRNQRSRKARSRIASA